MLDCEKAMENPACFIGKNFPLICEKISTLLNHLRFLQSKESFQCMKSVTFWHEIVSYLEKKFLSMHADQNDRT